MNERVTFRLNGARTTIEVDENRLLLWVLRTDLDLTGTKYGCGTGDCGSCTVTVDGAATRSCLTTMKEVAGRDVVTIEGLAKGDELHPLQKKFIEHGAFQCGYCTSGMLMSAASLLEHTPRPSREEIIRELDGNLCRCGAHQRIVNAVEDASRRIGRKS
jgi:aerobic-type carbon monoxide dehydrogenase small subunit (CoxS/CutS family)